MKLFSMANLSANQSAVNNTNIANGHISRITPQCFKPINGTVFKNHNHSLYKLYEHSNINKFKIFHQNIQGVSNKIDEVLTSVSRNAPQVICLTEHCLRTEEILNVNFSQCTLGASFCRQTYSYGGVCVFVPKNIQLSRVYSLI
jgi:hypothetical protein